MWPQTVTKEDLIIETKRGAGKGGQNKNKRDTAVRMVHNKNLQGKGSLVLD